MAILRSPRLPSCIAAATGFFWNHSRVASAGPATPFWPRTPRRCSATEVECSRWTAEGGWQVVEADVAPLDHLGRMMRRHPPVEVAGLPRFTGGAVGFLGYDIVRSIESLPGPPPDDRDLPDALLMVVDTLLVLDNLFNRATVIANVEVPPGTSAKEMRRLYEDARSRIECWLERLATPVSVTALQIEAVPELPQLPVPIPTGSSSRTLAGSGSTSPLETRFRRCFPGGWTYLHGPFPDLPLPARTESCPVLVLSPLRRDAHHRELTGDIGPGGGHRCHRPTHRWHPAPRCYPGGGCRPRRGAVRRSKGAPNT